MSIQSTADWQPRIRVWLHAGRWTDAVAFLIRQIQANAHDAAALTLLGDCYLAGGAGDCAALCYRRAQPFATRPLDSRLRLAAEVHEYPLEAWVTSGAVPGSAAALRARLPAAAPNLALDEPERLPRDSVEAAAGFVERLLAAPDPSAAVGEQLDEILNRTPDLLAALAEQFQREGAAGWARTVRSALAAAGA